MNPLLQILVFLICFLYLAAISVVLVTFILK